MHYRLDPSGNSELATGEFRVLCPLCGSPHVCQTEPGDPKYMGRVEMTVTDKRRLYDPTTFQARPFTLVIERAVPAFTCLAGDCGYAGHALRS